MAGRPAGEYYLQLNVGISENKKIRRLVKYGREARGLRDLYVQMLLYCKRNHSDGFVPAEEIGILVYPDAYRIGVRDARRLADAELVVETEGGYHLPGFLSYNRNMTRVEVEKLSAKRAAAGSRGGRARPKTRSSEQVEAPSLFDDDDEVAKQLAYDGASVGFNLETETEKEVLLASQVVPPAHAGTVVAAYVEGAKTAGQPTPSAKLCARVGKQARTALADKIDIGVLLAAARNMGAAGWLDLDVQIQRDAAAANGRATVGQTGYRPYSNPEDLDEYGKEF